MKAIIFVETGEVRIPRGDEWIVSEGEPTQSEYRAWPSPMPILRRIEVELPTRAEILTEAASDPVNGPAYEYGFGAGTRWLATRLGITLEDK